MWVEIDNPHMVPFWVKGVGVLLLGLVSTFWIPEVVRGL